MQIKHEATNTWTTRRRLFCRVSSVQSTLQHVHKPGNLWKAFWDTLEDSPDSKQTDSSPSSRSDLLLKHKSINCLCTQSSAAPLLLLSFLQITSALLFFSPPLTASVTASPPLNHLLHSHIATLLFFFPLLHLLLLFFSSSSSLSLQEPPLLLLSDFKCSCLSSFLSLLFVSSFCSLPSSLLLLLHQHKSQSKKPPQRLLSPLVSEWIYRPLKNRNTSQCVCVCVGPLSSHWTNRKWRSSGETGHL